MKMLFRIAAVVAALPILYVSGMLAVMTLGPADSYWSWVSWRVDGTQWTGDSIIRQLDAFRQRNGKYPNRLDELVPQYLRSIPAPRVGRDWIYESLEVGKEFKLMFAVGEYRYPNSRFYSQVGRWYTDE
jgi:hypothetical protein